MTLFGLVASFGELIHNLLISWLLVFPGSWLEAQPSVAILAQVFSIVFCLLPRLTLRSALSMYFMVVADLRALQCLAQSLLDVVNQLASRSVVPLPPPQFIPSSSKSRRLRKLQWLWCRYCGWQHDCPLG